MEIGINVDVAKTISGLMSENRFLKYCDSTNTSKHFAHCSNRNTVWPLSFTQFGLSKNSQTVLKF